MTKYCPSCGYANPDDARRCTRCGQPFPAPPTQQPQQPGGPAGGATWSPPQPPPYQPPPPPTQTYTPLDLEALGKIRLFALTGIVGIAYTVVALILIVPRLLGLLSTLPAGPQSLQQAIRSLGGVTAATGVAGAILFVAQFVFLYLGFRALSTADRSLHTPLLLLPFMLAGQIVALLLDVAVLAVNTAASRGPSVLGVLFPLEGVVVLLLLVGEVGGEVLGLWRVGERYGETLIQIGGVFYIEPLLNVVAPILVYAGCGRAQAKIRGQHQPPLNPQPPQATPPTPAQPDGLHVSRSLSSTAARSSQSLNNPSV